METQEMIGKFVINKPKDEIDDLDLDIEVQKERIGVAKELGIERQIKIAEKKERRLKLLQKVIKKGYKEITNIKGCWEACSYEPHDFEYDVGNKIESKIFLGFLGFLGIKRLTKLEERYYGYLLKNFPEPIPVTVMLDIKEAKDYFERIEIWSNEEIIDPYVVGTIGSRCFFITSWSEKENLV